LKSENAISIYNNIIMFFKVIRIVGGLVLIQLSPLDNKGMNNSSKTTSSKETEVSTSFVDLLRQISGDEEEKKEVDGLVFPVDRHLPTLPIEKLPLEAAPTTVDEVAVINLQSNTTLSGFALLNPNSDAFLLEHSRQNLVKQLEPTVVSILQESEQSIAKQANALAVSLFQDGEQIVAKRAEPSIATVLQQMAPQQTAPQQTAPLDNGLLNPIINNQMSKEMLKVTSEESSHSLNDNESVPQDGKEHLHMPGIISTNMGTSFSPSINMIDSKGRFVFEMPVRAEHLAKDVTNVLTTVIDVQNMENGLEAVFSLEPEHLGKVDVKVTIHEGNVRAEFFTSTVLGKDLLETQVQVLRTALEQQGFQVDKIDISQQNTNFSGPFSQKGDSHARQGQQESKKRNGQTIYNQEEEYRDYAAESGLVSQINTTA
jgi:flagellar hook-length control protein FliK